MEKLKVIDLGRKSYAETYQYQLEMLEKRYRDEITDTLILVEHPPVLTIGRSGTSDNVIVPEKFLKEKGIEVFEIDRGGDVTYHGPGQLVGYPVLKLTRHRKDLHWLLRSYEEVFIRLLENEFDLKAGRIPGLTGVWIGDKKITAIGVGVKHWVTFHGFAFNIDPELAHFKYIIPCGIMDKGVTSLKEILPDLSLNREEISNLVVKYFSDVFEMELTL